MNLAEPETVSLSKNFSREILKNYRPDTPVLKKIAALIARHDRFFLTTHIGADPDGIGSQVGLYYLLKKLKKKVIIVNSERIPSHYRFMVPEDIILNIEEDTEKIEKFNLSGGLALIMDNSETKRCEKVFELITKKKLPWATIDHHVVDKGARLCVDHRYGATAEIVWDLYHHLGVPLVKKAATALYAGIVADTGNFRFSRTSARTHLAAGELIGLGISSDDIYRRIFESAPIDRLVFLKHVLNEAIIDKKHGFAAGFARQSMFEGLKLGDTPTDGIVNQLLAVNGVKISALMTQTPDDDLKCSLRSVGDIDVSALAKTFGGGGHKNASGLFIKGPYDKAAKKVIAAIKKHLNGA